MSTCIEDNLISTDRRCLPEPTSVPVGTRAKNLAMRAVGRVGAGLSYLLGSRAGTSLGLLTYHRVSENIRGLPKPHHNVTPAAFREQLLGLCQRGFNFWPLKKALEHHSQNKAFPARTVVVTFDDGFGSVYSNAFPVLRELHIPATIFINTAFVDTVDPFPFDLWGRKYCGRVPQDTYQPLTMSQCHEMADSTLIEFGAHTHTHEDFRGRPDAFQDDLQQSIDLVSQQFEIDGVPFAFPFGSPRLGFAGGELEAAARRTNAICALTTEPVLVDSHKDPFSWGRFNAFDWDTSATLSGKLQGWYSWGPRLYGRLTGPRREQNL